MGKKNESSARKDVGTRRFVSIKDGKVGRSWRWLVVIIGVLFVGGALVCVTMVISEIQKFGDESQTSSTKVHVGERYVIESCEVMQVNESNTRVKVWCRSEVDGGNFLFFLDGVSEDVASQFEKVRADRDYISFDDVRPLKFRGQKESDGMNYRVFTTSQKFRVAKTKTSRVELKPSAVLDVAE